MTAPQQKIESLDSVDEQFRDLYTPTEGGFELAEDWLDKHVGALKRAKDHEKNLRSEEAKARRELEKRLAEYEEAQRKQGEDGHRKKGDVEALDKSWQEKLAKISGEKDAAITELQSYVERLTADSAARMMAGELAIDGGADALYKLIRGRFGMEIRDGQPVAVALGNDGKPSALTLKELQAEIQTDKSLSALLAGSKASGGSATGGKGGGAATGGKKPSEMTTAEKAEFIAEHGLEAWKKLL